MCPFSSIGVSISHSLILLASIFFCQNVWRKNLKEGRFVLNLSFLGDPAYHGREGLAETLTSYHE